MERKIQLRLKQWKDSPYRKPLILQGARQVGKTYAVLEFGRENYDNIIYINFELDHDAREIFAESLDPKEIVKALSYHTKESATKGKTLIFFDEVQVCGKALTSLKYFNEFANDYHIISAGSLLGVAVNREKEDISFPVGKVDMITLNPMDLEEFFWALGEEELTKKIRDCFEKDSPLSAIYHKSAMQYYKEYLIVGGMPECVSQYVETKDFLLIRHTQNTILESYLNDMSKYNKDNEIKKTRLAYQSATTQLSKRNTKFQYKLIKKGGRAAEFENAVEWLRLSGIVSQVYKTEQIKKPLDDYKDVDAFKIYISDVGLLSAKKNIIPNDVLFDSAELNDFKGGLVENYANFILRSNGYETYYWESENRAEIDFVIQREGNLIPVEVKSSDNTKSKSLKVYMERFKPKYAIKLSAKNFGFEDNKKTVPLYAAFCI